MHGQIYCSGYNTPLPLHSIVYHLCMVFMQIFMSITILRILLKRSSLHARSLDGRDSSLMFVFSNKVIGSSNACSRFHCYYLGSMDPNLSSNPFRNSNRCSFSFASIIILLASHVQLLQVHLRVSEID